MKEILILLWVVTLPVFWILLTPLGERSRLGESLTAIQLKRTQKIIDLHQKKLGYLPRNLTDIRVAGLSYWGRYQPYDGYGNRLHYIALNRSDYLVKSFGVDGEENTPNSQPDPAATSLPAPAPLPPVYKEPASTFIRLYPSILLMGAKSPSSPFVAQLFINYETHKRHLTIRHPKRPEFFMLAPHPGVEEFLWLANGYEIVFTATANAHYGDGLYVWNTLTNKTRNLLADFSDTIELTEGDAAFYYLSLAATDETGYNFYAFIHPRYSEELAPEQFYTNESFYRVRIPRRPEERASFTRMSEFGNLSVFNFLQHPAQDIYTPFVGFPAQKTWSRLPVSGDLQQVIESWQDFSVNYPDSPMFPYSLWWLASIYSDAYEVLKAQRHQDADTLRAYGAELARALAKLSMPPAYLRAMGFSLAKRLISNQGLQYRVSDITSNVSSHHSLKATPRIRN